MAPTRHVRDLRTLTLISFREMNSITTDRVNDSHASIGSIGSPNSFYGKSRKRMTFKSWRKKSTSCRSARNLPMCRRQSRSGDRGGGNKDRERGGDDAGVASVVER